MFREFAFLVLTSPICLGAWEDVVALHKGDRVGVVQSDKKRIEGRFDSATGSTITLEENGAIQSLSRDQVVRVYARPKVNRVARIAIGAAIGAAGGLALDVSVGQRFRNEGKEIVGALYGVSIGAGAAIGAVSGGGYKTLYQAAVKPTAVKD